jgi:glycylpeptide N-tetradecanoyltransferase
MISYYHLHSSIQKNESHSHLRAAYSFYNVATSVDLEDLMRNALILAKKEDMDVFNALEQMKNKDFFDALKFGKGDGMLQYYLYNWCCPTMEPKDVGIVLL